MSTATRERPAAAKIDRAPAPPDFTEEALSSIHFKTDLEDQHGPLSESEPALMINPMASTLVLVSSAQARMQALAESTSAWLCMGEQPTDMHEVLRPMHHLAQEVEMLLEAVADQLMKGRRHG